MTWKAIGIATLAVFALALSAGTSAGHGSDTAAHIKITTLQIEAHKLQVELNRQRNLIESMKRRAVRLTSECDGQKCMLKEAVTYGSYGECAQSIAPDKAQFSLCMPMFDNSAADVPNSP